MTIERIERTSIWEKTLSSRPSDEYEYERDKLRTAFLSLREKVSYLTTQIASVLPELTQHEISHLDALWETADLIIGDHFELTPLEGFVLGSAFLLHDSALCFEAYDNGRDGLRNTVQWKDAYSDLMESSLIVKANEIEHQADFIALRNLHAYQAENLLKHKWNFSNGNDIYLLDDTSLRTHLGKIIGQIASSHHWDIETVISTFNTQLNAPTGYPRQWRIDPTKLAFILRCSDAAHIDNERAPDFLFALLKRNGISLDHWKAQNRLAKLDVDQSDVNGNTLLYTSSIDFNEEDSNAWFVAYDAICLVDKEIKLCNSILEKNIGRSFRIQKVKGVESPERMSVYVKANGWEPRSAKVHVGNVERIIQNLGGEMLYGTGADMLCVVLREMIQNARDSIKARNIYDIDNEGKIIITLEKDADSMWITIEDNGIGMSERILTGSLLDFGTSFWTSSLVQSEFPGLRSSKFRPIGKFGIGFYSVFMLADQVFIASRGFRSGLNDMLQLKFAHGFTLRPVLTRQAPPNFNTLISTQVKIKLKPGILSEDLLIEIKSNRMGVSNFKVPFKDYLATICGGLDVSIFYKDNNTEEKIHENIGSEKFNKAEWLTKISFAEFRPNSEIIKSYISDNISRLKPIIENGALLGIAAISTMDRTGEQYFLSLNTVGGLASEVNGRDGDIFIGYIDHLPKSAKRENGNYAASEETIHTWAIDQFEELTNLGLNPVERYIASSALCHFKVDPSEIALILTVYNGRGEFLSFDQLAELSRKMKIVFLNSGLGVGHIETHHQIKEMQGYALIRPITNGSFLSLEMINGVPKNNFSILDCLYKSIIKKGCSPVLEEVDCIGKNVFGQDIGAIIVSSS